MKLLVRRENQLTIMMNLPRTGLWRATMAAISVLCWLAGPLTAQFGPPADTTKVVYNPSNLQAVQGEAPFSYQYDLSVKSPAALPVGNTVVTMTAAVLVVPEGSNAAQAATYMTFMAPGTSTPMTTLTFTGPNQTRTVTVSLSIPTGSETGDFQYFISTPGWPAGFVDQGTYVNTHVNPPSGLTPPTATVTVPEDGAIFTHTVGGPALMVDIAVEGEATENAPVTALQAFITGEDEDGQIFLPESPLAIAITGLGTPLAEGFVALPVNAAGLYTIRTVATNVMGSNMTTSQFTVEEEVPPPTVAISAPANNPSYTYVRGFSSVSVPYVFTAETLRGSIQTVTVMLDGNPITPTSVTGIGQSTVTGSGTIIFDASTVNGVGQHTIAVTVTSASGEASTSATFVIAEELPTMGLDIAQPVNGAVYPLPPNATPLNIPFSFTTSVTHGGTVKVVAATLSDENGTNSVTLTGTTGLNTPTATASGVLSGLQPGEYTFSATGENADLDLSAFDSATFTVTPPSAPAIEFTQAPQASYTTLTGYALSIPFAIRTSSTGAYIATQTVTLDGEPVAISSTVNGTALVATASGTLTIPAPDNGTTTYTLTATGVDAYGQDVSVETNFTVTVNDPQIAISINSQIAANSPYTLSGGKVTIPFVFTGTITSGATVDTITGDLGGQAVTISSSSGLGSAATATASGNLVITAPGTYVLTATAANTKSGASATTSITFVVKPAQALPPLTVTVTQAPQPTYTLSNICDPLRIPITFVGSSNGGQVKVLSATLDGQSVSLSSISGLNSSKATGTATLSVKKAGTHVLVVTAKDNFSQTVTSSVTFNVVIQKPTISIVINSPTNNSVYTLTAGSDWCNSTPVSIPFSFTSTITAGSTIDSLSAMLNGCSVSISKSGLGTATAKGSGTLKISKPGTYTLTAKAYDERARISATTSITIIVKKAAPPTVTIVQPTATTYSASEGTTLSIPFVFKAASTSGGISKLAAKLDGKSVNVSSSGIGSANATGSGTLGVKTAGKHVLTVEATDKSGTSTASFAFTVTVTKPTPTVKITDPDDGETFTYEDGDAAPKIPFAIEAETSAGATISSIKASLNNSSVNVSTSGIGSGKAKGTGQLSIPGPGTYTLTATTVSGGVSATAKVKFTVKKLPAPTCTPEWRGAIKEGKAQKAGRDVEVKFQLKKKSSSGKTSTVRDNAVKISVCEIERNGSSGKTKVYSSSHYSINSSDEYCFKHLTDRSEKRYRVEVYSFAEGSNKPKLLGSKEFDAK